MNAAITQKLKADFPKLYRLERFGFACGDGWYQLIHDLSGDIENEAKKSGLNPESDSWPVAHLVKQKFGTLRFHCYSGDGTVNQTIYALIKQAEQASTTICEQCGQPGKLQTAEGVWHVVCPDCKAWQEAEEKAWQEAEEGSY